MNSFEVSAGRRAQPPRQTRNNPPRSSVPGSRAFGSRASLGGLESGSLDQPTAIFPAITHFADAITALPNELVRHFTLLKEVDAKIFGPEEDLSKLVDAALNAPPPQPPHANNAVGPTSAPMSAQGSVNGSMLNGHVGSVPEDVYNPVDMAYDAANLQRRQLFQHCAYTMSNMLVSLDEKNHVISTAAEALNKQLARIDECFPYIELEVSEEARYGSITHWAYPENRATKLTSGGRRQDVAAANTLTAAAQHLVDEAAARSDARKQALLAKKSNKHQTESDFDDSHKEPSKKLHGNSKVRKAADASLGIGLGMTNGAANGNPSKRRKVEKGSTAGTAMERAISSVYGSNGTATKGKGGSPRGTPGPEAKKRSRAVASTNGQTSRKRYVLDWHCFGVKANIVPFRNNTVTSVAMSPSLASSPIRPTFPESKLSGRASPQPINGGRPASSRARQNSTQSVVEPVKQSSVFKANGASTPDLTPVAEATGRTIAEVKSTMKETATSSKEHLLEDVDKDDADLVGGLVVGNRRDSTMKREDTETNSDVMQGIQVTAVTTKSGRASKPSTPAIPQFPEPVRSRSTRNALDTASSNKRSHKKGAGAAAQQLLAQQNSEVDDGASSIQGDDEDGELADEDMEVDPDEPTYCYCNRVSFGDMIGCDAENCEKEWFHLPCVGLKAAPKGNGVSPVPLTSLPSPTTDLQQPNGTATTAKKSSNRSASMVDRSHVFIIMTRNQANFSPAHRILNTWTIWTNGHYGVEQKIHGHGLEFWGLILKGVIANWLLPLVQAPGYMDGRHGLYIRIEGFWVGLKCPVGNERGVSS
jgi:hypothetical protein